MEQIITYLIMVQKCTNFKAKDSGIVAAPLCLGKISKDRSVDNMKKTEFTGYVYDFSVDYDAIHKYLMKKNNIA